jgi:hypothetical protein
MMVTRGCPCRKGHHRGGTGEAGTAIADIDGDGRGDPFFNLRF